METKRDTFSGKLGFVFAAAGSAVGLGNLWRFPYLAAKYGGGIFILVYLILAVTLGFTLMITEIAIGRKTGLSAVGAFQKLDKRFGFVGKLVVYLIEFESDPISLRSSRMMIMATSRNSTAACRITETTIIR